MYLLLDSWVMAVTAFSLFTVIGLYLQARAAARDTDTHD